MEKSDSTYYLYKIKAGETVNEFKIGNSPAIAGANSPEWARLDCHKCTVCNLEEESSPYCPAALSIAEIIEQFKDIVSYHEVEAEVISSGRKTSARIPAQSALSSVMGLCLALSSCPILKEFRAMAKFHLPFSNTEETLYRAVGNYLIKQYFAYKSGEEADWDLKGLREFYSRVAELNTCLACRVREGTNEDAAINAVVILDNYAKNVEYMFEQALEKIKKYL